MNGFYFGLAELVLSALLVGSSRLYLLYALRFSKPLTLTARAKLAITWLLIAGSITLLTVAGIELTGIFNLPVTRALGGIVVLVLGGMSSHTLFREDWKRFRQLFY